jgi:hypothetical protein
MDGNGVNEFSMNKVSSDGVVTLLLFESQYGTCAGCSFVNEYEGKFYLGGSNGFAIYDVATNTVSYQAAPAGSLLTRQMLWNGDEVVSKSNDDITIGSSDLKASDGTTLVSNSTDTDGDAITVIGSNELVDAESAVLIGNSTDADGDAITVIGSNELVGENGNTLISEESDGSIHIGENSLVTVEKDGVQLLYATDANDEQIDINIKAGTDLLVDGKSVTQALTDIDTNKTNIATNTTNIATNTAGIATNKTNIATNTTNIATNTAGIATNKTNIATNTTNIATNTAGIATNKTNIATNTTNIATNATGIANNVVRLDNLAALAASNTSRIEGLETLTGLMQNEYRSGIASSIALSQIQYAASGFSIGVGHGEFKNKDEMAVGIGYGGQFNEDVGFQFQFGTSGDSTGFGFTVNF